MHEAFHKHPYLQSVLMLFGQFWSDEAIDSVEYWIVASELAFPNLEARQHYEDSYLSNDPVNNPHSDGHPSFGIGPDYWDENGEPISLFAAYCKGFTSQEDRSIDRYTPYALFERVPDELPKLTIVGKQYRPHLNGILPTWADENFDNDGDWYFQAYIDHS